MDPHQLLGLTGPANNFAMGGLPMHFANILIAEWETGATNFIYGPNGGENTNFNPTCE